MPISSLLTSTIRMTISQMPLDVDRGIELPQLELTHNFTGDCTTAYSTGFPFPSHFWPDIFIIETTTNGFESPSYRTFWASRTCLRLSSFCWGEIVLSILPKDRSLLLPWNWKYRPSKNLEIRLSPKHFPEELLISSKKDFAFQFLAIKTFSFQTFFVPRSSSKRLTFTIAGNFTCLEVVFKFKRRLGWGAFFGVENRFYISLVQWMISLPTSGTTFFTLTCPPAWSSSCPGYHSGSNRRWLFLEICQMVRNFRKNKW